MVVLPAPEGADMMKIISILLQDPNGATINVDGAGMCILHDSHLSSVGGLFLVPANVLRG